MPAPGAIRVAIVSQCYLPDVTGNAAYAHGLAAALVTRGHHVTVLASRHGYVAGGAAFPVRETVDGVHVVRLPASGKGTASMIGRIVEYGYFFCHSWRRIATGPRYDLVIAITTPPYIGLCVRWAARWRRIRVAHWVLDCYPDAIAAALGVAKSRKFPWRLALAALGRVSRLQWRPGNRVVTLGPAIAERVRAYHGKTPAWIPLWADERMCPWSVDTPIPLRQERSWENESLVLCYSGNLGRGHCWREFAEAAGRLGPQGPLWVFVGSGNRRSQLAEWHRAHPQARLNFLPYAPHERLREHLCSPDIHLISMETGWEGCIVPSKLQNAFAVGRPVLAVVPAASETALWIRASGGGWVVEPGDVTGLLTAVEEVKNSVERARRGALAAAYAQRHFSASGNLEAIAQLFTVRVVSAHRLPTQSLSTPIA